MAFDDDEKRALNELKARFPNAAFQQRLDLIQQNALFIFQRDWSRLSEVKLHLNSTENATEIPLKTGVNGTLICWQNLTIYTLDKPLKTNLKTPLKVDVLVLQKNVYVTPEKLKANFNPAIIVFDSSNEGWYVRWLGAKLIQNQLPFHDVNTQGAFVKLPPKQGFN